MAHAIGKMLKRIGGIGFVILLVGIVTTCALQVSDDLEIPAKGWTVPVALYIILGICIIIWLVGAIIIRFSRPPIDHISSSKKQKHIIL
jgi:hypothetical protein